MKRIALFLALAVAFASAAAACDDWQSYDICYSQSEGLWSSCIDACAANHSHNYDAYRFCADGCSERHQRRVCACYVYCDPWAYTQYC